MAVGERDGEVGVGEVGICEVGGIEYRVVVAEELI